MLIVDVCFWKFEGSEANPDSYGEVIHLPKPDMFVAAPKMRRMAEGIETTAHDETAPVPAANQVEHSACLRFGFYPLLDRGKGRIDDVQVRKLISIKLFCDLGESFLRVFVAHVIKCFQR